MVDKTVISYKLEGIDSYRKQLQSLPEKLRKKALKKALRVAGNVIVREARDKAPVLDPVKASRMKRKKTGMNYRKSGTVRKAIKLRVSKLDARAGDVGVFVNVKPAKGSDKGSYSPNDPYYWRWLEFGHKIVARSGGKQAGGKQAGGETNFIQRLRNGKLQKRTAKWKASSLTGRRRLSAGSVSARPFLRPAAEKLEEAKRVFEREALPAIEALNNGR